MSCAVITATALALLIGCLGLVGCGGKDDGKEKAVKKLPVVSVETVREQPISRLLEMTGETVAVESVIIAATVEGPISYCPWREGDRVALSPAGPTRLIEIGRELYRAEVKLAAASLDVAKAKLEDLKAGTRPEEIAKARETVRQLSESTGFARNELERISRLVERGSFPDDALEKARVMYIVEQANLAAARRHFEMLEAGYTKTAIAVQEAVVKEEQARLELADARLKECVIMAPFAGTITRVYVRPGDMASVKVPLLEMADLSSLVIRAAVPEAYALAVREGMIAHIALDSLPGTAFTGKVARLYPELDRQMRTRTVELAVDGPATLVPGMFARVRLVLESVQSAVTVSLQAIVKTPTGDPSVYVIVDGKAVRRKVRIGIEQTGRVQVLEGLAAGEKIAVAGHEKMKDGIEVRLTEPVEGQSGNNLKGDRP